MITILKAKKLVENETGKKAASCAFMEDYYIFAFKGDQFLFKAVNRNDGKISNFTPSIDLLGYCEAKKITF